MKKRFKHLILLSIITFSLAIPAVYAYMYMKTQKIDNTFVPAIADCEVVEEFNGTTKSSIKVKSTSNVDCYIRVKLITYWQDTKGNIVGISSDKLNFNTTNDWIHDTVNDVYYYKYPVKVGQTTNEFLSNGSTITLKQTSKDVTSNGITVKYYYNQVVEIHSEAIQANPPKAVFEAWGAVVDPSSGYITSIN